MNSRSTALSSIKATVIMGGVRRRDCQGGTRRDMSHSAHSVEKRVKSAAEPFYDRFGPRTHRQLFIDAIEMVLHRRRADVERRRDFLVSQAARKDVHDFAFAHREIVRRAAVSRPG